MKENDIVIKRISSEEELWFAERLYLSSFPDGEKRNCRLDKVYLDKAGVFQQHYRVWWRKSGLHFVLGVG